MSYRSLIADMQVPYCAKSHQRIRSGLLEYECKLLGGCLITEICYVSAVSAAYFVVVL